MDLSGLADEIAALAHRCWCKQMIHRGWRYGERFDPDARTHDAIRPFEELTPLDREQIRRCVGWEECEQYLANAIRDALLERELSERDMRVGLVVKLRDGRLRDDLTPELGRVVSWEVANRASGRLDLIRVEWPDGEVVEYGPGEHDLEPVDHE